METFSLQAQHSGGLNHLHSFAFSDSAVDVVREVRKAVTIVVIGWVVVTTIRLVKSGIERSKASE